MVYMYTDINGICMCVYIHVYRHKWHCTGVGSFDKHKNKGRNTIERWKNVELDIYIYIYIYLYTYTYIYIHAYI